MRVRVRMYAHARHPPTTHPHTQTSTPQPLKQNMAASEGGKEVVYIRAIVKDFGHPQQGYTEIYEDNLVAFAMSTNPAPAPQCLLIPHPPREGNILIRF